MFKLGQGRFKFPSILIKQQEQELAIDLKSGLAFFILKHAFIALINDTVYLNRFSLFQSTFTVTLLFSSQQSCEVE